MQPSTFLSRKRPSKAPLRLTLFQKSPSAFLSLIGFDNIPSTALPRIELTTIEQPKREMAVQAVDMLRDKIENGTQGYVHQILMPSLVKRGSCQKI